jgi:hypothetical protein
MLSGLLGLAFVLSAAPVAATPVSYAFASGAVTLYASSGGSPVAGPISVSLTGVSVTVDQAFLTVPSLEFTVGSTGAIAISYGAYTSFTLDSASITESAPGTLVLNDAGPPKEYGFTIAVDIDGHFDAVSSTDPSPPSYTDTLFSIPGASGDGLIFIDGTELVLSQITIGAIDPDGDGGLAPLLVKGDFTFVGVVPEPGTVLLLGAGLVGLAARARRSSDRC